MHDTPEQMMLPSVGVPLELDHLLETLGLEDLQLLCFSSLVHKGGLGILEGYFPVRNDDVHVYLG